MNRTLGNLNQVEKIDNCRYKVSYEYWWFEDKWTYTSQDFKTEEDALRFIDELRKDMQKRFISYDKWTIFHEVFEEKS